MRVMLVEDHSAMSFGIRTFLELVGKIKVVGEAADAETALQIIEESNPALVLLDLRLQGDKNGIKLCKEIKGLVNPPKVLVHTAFDSGEEMLSAVVAGADGFVHKGVDHEKLPQIIQDVCAGVSVWLPGEEKEEAELQVENLAKDGALTSKETEVAILVIRRYTNAEIAEKLCVSVTTVKSHVSSILRKLNLKSRSGIIQNRHLYM